MPFRRADDVEPKLPTAIGGPGRQSFTRSSPQATFLSQLIAERYHMSTQRARRQAPVSLALETYDEGARAGQVRMPAGYRKTVVA